MDTDATFPTPKKQRASLTVEKVEAALSESRGMIAVAARKIHCDRSHLHKYIAKHPVLVELLAHEREFTTDTAELALYRAITSGEAWAVCFYLKTQGRNRGYIERTEHTGENGEPIKFIVLEPTRGRDVTSAPLQLEIGRSVDS